LSARLPLYPARRKSARGHAALRQLVHNHAARRPMARSRLDICHLGWLTWLLSCREPWLAGFANHPWLASFGKQPLRSLSRWNHHFLSCSGRMGILSGGPIRLSGQHAERDGGFQRRRNPPMAYLTAALSKSCPGDGRQRDRNVTCALSPVTGLACAKHAGVNWLCRPGRGIWAHGNDKQNAAALEANAAVGCGGGVSTGALFHVAVTRIGIPVLPVLTVLRFSDGRNH